MWHGCASAGVGGRGIRQLVPDSAEYAGNGCWRYRGFTIQAIEQENPLDGRRFKFVAVARAKNFLFDDLI